MSDTEERRQTGESMVDDAERKRRQNELNKKLLEAVRTMTMSSKTSVTAPRSPAETGEGTLDFISALRVDTRM